MTDPDLDVSDGKASKARFLADVMLGSLARWLRILGYDTAYQNRIGDLELVRWAQQEDRVVLTRNRRLCRRRALRGRHLLIESQQLEAQLLQVLESIEAPFPSSLALSRCLLCNRRLLPFSHARAREKVPPYVWRTQQEFKRCPECGRIFWRGTHRERMAERLAGLAFSRNTNQ